MWSQRRVPVTKGAAVLQPAHAPEPCPTLMHHAADSETNRTEEVERWKMEMERKAELITEFGGVL